MSYVIRVFDNDGTEIERTTVFAADLDWQIAAYRTTYDVPDGSLVSVTSGTRIVID